MSKRVMEMLKYMTCLLVPDRQLLEVILLVKAVTPPPAS